MADMMLPATEVGASLPAGPAGGQSGTSSARPAKLPSKPSAAAKSSRRKLPYICQVAECGRRLATEKHYYRRFRVCKKHAVQAVVHTCGRDRRYCQQCSVFHDLHEFDGSKRSCRARLSWHACLRRKRGVSDDSSGWLSTDDGEDNVSSEPSGNLGGPDVDASAAQEQLTLEKLRLVGVSRGPQEEDVAMHVEPRSPLNTMVLIGVARAAQLAEQAREAHVLGKTLRQAGVDSHFTAGYPPPTLASQLVALPKMQGVPIFRGADQEPRASSPIHPKKRLLQRWAKNALAVASCGFSDM